MVRLKVSLLGGLRAQLASGASLRLPTKKSRALLAYLAVRAQPVARDTLAATFWGDSAQEQARQSLRQTLAVLRKALGSTSSKVLLIEGDTLALNAAGVEVDVVRFQRLVHAGSPSALAQAAELYQGELLDGFHLNGAPFEDWLTAERTASRSRLSKPSGDSSATSCAPTGPPRSKPRRAPSSSTRRRNPSIARS